MVGKRGEEHDEKNQMFLLKVLCSRSFCREIQIIYSHLLSFGAEGSLVLHEKRMSLAPLQSFLSGQQTELLWLSTIPALTARSWQGLPGDIKWNGNVFLLQARSCLCCITSLCPEGCTTFPSLQGWGS